MEKDDVLEGRENVVVKGVRRLVVGYKEYWEEFKRNAQRTLFGLEGRVVNFRIDVFVDLVTSERCSFQIDELSPFCGLLPGMRGGHVLDLIALEVLNPWPEETK